MAKVRVGGCRGHDWSDCLRRRVCGQAMTWCTWIMIEVSLKGAHVGMAHIIAILLVLTHHHMGEQNMVDGKSISYHTSHTSESKYTIH